MFFHIRFGHLISIGFMAAAMTLCTGCAELEQKVNPQSDIDHAVGLYVDAIVHHEAQEWDLAIQKLIEAIEINPRFSLAYSLQGDIYQQVADFEKSADAYETATRLDPWSFNDYFNLGKVCRIMEKFVRSVRAFVRACELDPQHFEAHLYTAEVFFTLKEYDQAIAFSRMAERIDPQKSEPQLLIGNVHEANDNFAEAIAWYKRALEIEGNKPDNMVSLARAYLKTQQYGPAKELLDSAIEIDPQNALAYRHMGFAYLKLHDIDKAIANYEMSAQLNRNDWENQKALGVAYMIKAMKKNTDKRLKVIDSDEVRSLKAKAIEHWKISLGLNPDQPNLAEFLSQYSD